MNRNTPLLVMACLLAAIFLPSCAATPENQAKKARLAAIGDGLVNLGVKTKYITPEEAELIREGGAIILETKGTPATPIIQPAPTPPLNPPPSGKEVYNPFAYYDRPADPLRALCRNAPPTGPPRLHG